MTLHREPLSMTTEEQLAELAAVLGTDTVALADVPQLLDARAQQLDGDAARQTGYGAAEAFKAANLNAAGKDPAAVRAFLTSAVEYVRQAALTEEVAR